MINFQSIINKTKIAKYDREDRLIEFTVRIIDAAEALPKTVASKNLSGQIVWSETSPALNYAEAQSAESKADFVHKIKICLKELRETFVCLKIIQRKGYFKETRLEPLLNENMELVSIFVKSIQTAKSKAQ